MSNDNVISSNGNRKAEWTPLCNIYLLFPEQGTRPSTQAIADELGKRLGEIEIVSDKEENGKTCSFFGLLDHKVSYENDTAFIPAQLLVTDYENSDVLDKLTPLELSQQWFCPEYQEIINRTKYTIMITDFMAAGLPNVERLDVLTNFVETAVELFPDCIGVYIESCGVILTPDAIRENSTRKGARGLYMFMNIRFFNIEGTDGDMVVDSYGLYKFGLPDIQYHFHDLTPSAVVNHCFNVAAYIFTDNVDIKDGETIDGLKNGEISRDVYWQCQHEISLIEPEREVLDINTCEFAAGNRNPQTKNKNRKNKY